MGKADKALAFMLFCSSSEEPEVGEKISARPTRTGQLVTVTPGRLVLIVQSQCSESQTLLSVKTGPGGDGRKLEAGIGNCPDMGACLATVDGILSPDLSHGPLSFLIPSPSSAL